MSYMEIAFWFAIPMMSLAIIMAVYRLVRGPSSADRVLALDLLANFGIGVIALTSIAYSQAVFLDIAIVLALVAYLATVTFAYYIEKRIGS